MRHFISDWITYFMLQWLATSVRFALKTYTSDEAYLGIDPQPAPPRLSLLSIQNLSVLVIVPKASRYVSRHLSLATRQ